MTTARHIPRHARLSRAVGRIFGEPLREQRGDKSDPERWNREYASCDGVLQSGAVRTFVPA
jgi:hypothetical protein